YQLLLRCLLVCDIAIDGHDERRGPIGIQRQAARDHDPRAILSKLDQLTLPPAVVMQSGINPRALAWEHRGKHCVHIPSERPALPIRSVPPPCFPWDDSPSPAFRGGKCC